MTTNKVTRAEFEMKVVPDDDPDVSWLKEEGNEEQLADYEAGRLHFVGVQASMTVKIDMGSGSHVLHTVTSPGLWGIDSGFFTEYHKEVFEEECDTLERMLRGLALAADREALTLARSLIRDMAAGWPAGELASPPAEVAARLTALIGDEYDFSTGDTK